jgi:hypothetical protein
MKQTLKVIGRNLQPVIANQSIEILMRDVCEYGEAHLWMALWL